MLTIDSVVNLNVGGTTFTTSLKTLRAEVGSKLDKWFSNPSSLTKDSNGFIFIDRCGATFSYVLEYLRAKQSVDPTKCFSSTELVLPSTCEIQKKLKAEADFFGLSELAKELENRINLVPCTITLSYRGLIPAGRDSLADVQFRKITRILVSGKSSVCREIFGATLNESRAPDCGPEDNRYSSRYYLTHNVLEMAFDKLLEADFNMVGCCGGAALISNSQKFKGIVNDCDEGRSQYFHEFYFIRQK